MGMRHLLGLSVKALSAPPGAGSPRVRNPPILGLSRDIYLRTPLELGSRAIFEESFLSQGAGMTMLREADLVCA